ncbi:MAG: tetratricopeptide repeat protein [Polyangiaceae bacterium]|nr:tetratricopeptide repeat protein [Polyangiaceae bacterium]
MDQFSAHLDRGWELISRNDPRGAEASARRALELDPQSPEAYNLLGYCAALDGNPDDAIEAYRQAIALDETYFEAMLNAAEVLIHPMHEYQDAIEMCDLAIDLAQTDEETVDALLLMFDAVLGRDGQDLTEAQAVLERLPPPPYDNPAHTFLVGRAHYEVGEIDRARALIEEAAAKDPTHAEAWYYLALVRDERGDQPGATSAFLRSRELDLGVPAPAWSLGRDDLRELGRQVIATIDPNLGRFVRKADLFISDVPGIELVADGVDPRALVLFDGINVPELGVPVARVFLYQRNIERLAGGPDGVEGELRAAVEREVQLTFPDADSPGGAASRDLN